MLDEINIPFLLGVLLFLILISAFFSASETAMMRLNRYKLRHKAEHHPNSLRILKLISQPEHLLGVVLIGNTFANILASSIATVLFCKIFGEKIGMLIASLGMTFLLLLFAEVMPKNVGALNSERIANLSVIPLQMLLWVLYPVVVLVNWISQGILMLFRVRIRNHEQDSLNREELRAVVREAGNLISKRYRRMLVSILDLEDVSVEDIMISKNDVLGIDLEDEPDTILKQICNSSHTLLPVYRKDLNQIVGMLHIRDAIHLFQDEAFDVKKLEPILLPPIFVAEGTPLNKQLFTFQRKKQRMGLVVDEYGDILGLVTLADILEEIVGEFTTDLSVTHREIIPQTDSSYLIDGSITVRMLNHKLRLNLSNVKAKTLSGLITEVLQAIPQVGTCVLIQGYPVEIIHVSDNLVKTAKIYPKKRFNSVPWLEPM